MSENFRSSIVVSGGNADATQQRTPMHIPVNKDHQYRENYVGEDENNASFRQIDDSDERLSYLLMNSSLNGISSNSDTSYRQVSFPSYASAVSRTTFAESLTGDSSISVRYQSYVNDSTDQGCGRALSSSDHGTRGASSSDPILRTCRASNNESSSLQSRSGGASQILDASMQRFQRETTALRNAYLTICRENGIESAQELVRSIRSSLKTGAPLVRLSICHALVDDLHVAVLLEVLRSVNHSISEILLNHNQITDVGAIRIAEFMLNSTQILSLELFGNELTDNCCVAFKEILQRNTSLKRLKIGDNRISASGAILLSEGLRDNSSISQLHLGGNKIETDGLNAIALALEGNSVLTSLGLRDNGLGPDSIDVLASRTLQHPNVALSDIQLKGNNLSAQGAYSLSRALLVNSSLKVLELQSNKIGPEGCRELCHALIVNSSIHALNFNENDLSDDGASFIGDLLLKNSCITTLGLANNRIRKRGAAALAKALEEGCLTLTGLDLGSNELGNSGSCSLANALKSNSVLTSLDLRQCGIHLKGVLALAEAASVNSSLRHLDLGANHAKNQGAVQWGLTISSNSTLTRLCLTDNQIYSEGGHALLQGLCTNTTLRNFAYGGQGQMANRIDSLVRRSIDAIVHENKKRWECLSRGETPPPLSHDLRKFSSQNEMFQTMQRVMDSAAERYPYIMEKRYQMGTSSSSEGSGAEMGGHNLAMRSESGIPSMDMGGKNYQRIAERSAVPNFSVRGMYPAFANEESFLPSLGISNSENSYSGVPEDRDMLWQSIHGISEPGSLKDTSMLKQRSQPLLSHPFPPRGFYDSNRRFSESESFAYSASSEASSDHSPTKEIYREESFNDRSQYPQQSSRLPPAPLSGAYFGNGGHSLPFPPAPPPPPPPPPLTSSSISGLTSHPLSNPYPAASTTPAPPKSNVSRNPLSSNTYREVFEPSRTREEVPSWMYSPLSSYDHMDIFSLDRMIEYVFRSGLLHQDNSSFPNYYSVSQIGRSLERVFPHVSLSESQVIRFCYDNPKFQTILSNEPSRSLVMFFGPVGADPSEVMRDICTRSRAVQQNGRVGLPLHSQQQQGLSAPFFPSSKSNERGLAFHIGMEDPVVPYPRTSPHNHQNSIPRSASDNASQSFNSVSTPATMDMQHTSNPYVSKPLPHENFSSREQKIYSETEPRFRESFTLPSLAGNVFPAPFPQPSSDSLSSSHIVNVFSLQGDEFFPPSTNSADDSSLFFNSIPSMPLPESRVSEYAISSSSFLSAAVKPPPVGINSNSQFQSSVYAPSPNPIQSSVQHGIIGNDMNKDENARSDLHRLSERRGSSHDEISSWFSQNLDLYQMNS